MDTSAALEDGCGVELTGRKKSRFKLLKSRLFGRLKRKESEGLMKQSQSASDVTADVTTGGSAGGYDSGDDCLAAQGTLGSRALSHDSIFLADQSQGSAEPSRVLSQENVHGKIRALQLKLHQQNLRMGPPPLVIPGKRMVDSGATSEDDGLPHSPPDVSFHDGAGHGSSYKLTVLHTHHSSLSLAGTGSEEEEQWSSQPSSRPLSPANPATPSDNGSSLGVDLSSPAQYTPSLDTSAARHRLSVKPRNQRASAKGGKLPLRASRRRSESLSDLDQALTEGGEEQEQETVTAVTTPEEPLSSRALKREDGNAAPVPLLQTRPPSPPGQPEEKPWSLPPSAGEEDVVPRNEEPSMEDGRFTKNPLFLQTMPQKKDTPPVEEPTKAKTPTPDSLTTTSPVMAIEQPQRLPEPVLTKSAIAHTLPSNAKKELAAYDQRSSSPCRKTSTPLNDTVFGLDSASSSNEPPSRERAEETMSPETTSNRSLGKDAASGPAQVSALPTRAPRVTRDTQRPPASAGTTVAPPAGQDEKLPVESARVAQGRGEGFSFGSSPRLSSARLHPKTGGSGHSGGGEEVKGGRRDGREKGDGSLAKNHTNRGCVGRHSIKTEKVRPNGRAQLTNEGEESLCVRKRESEEQKTTEEDTDRRSDTKEGENEGVQSERKGKGEEEGRRGAFGVKLRSTSQSVKYRSETVQSELRVKRHSIEIMATEPRPIRGEEDAGSKVRSNTAVGSEPVWMSMAREKTRSLQQHFTSLAASEINPNVDARAGGATLPQQTPTRPCPTPQPRSQPTPQPPTLPSSLQGETEKSWKRSDKSGEMIASAETKTEVGKGQVENVTIKPEISSSSSSSSSSSVVSAWQQSVPPGAQPSWMELAKRKAMAWNDKTMD